VERGRDPPAARAAMNASTSARPVRASTRLRCASQRDNAAKSARYAAKVFGDSPRSIQTASRKRPMIGSMISAAESAVTVAGLLNAIPGAKADCLRSPVCKLGPV
jgi:hypothetical protein